MFKILYTADLHGNKDFYKKLFNEANKGRAQAVILGGDLCPHGHLGISESIQFQKKFIVDFLIPEIKKFIPFLLLATVLSPKCLFY